MGGAVTGVHARVRWGYHEVAVLRDFVISAPTPPAQTRTATGRVTSSNAFQLRCRPLEFVVPYSHGEMRWPVLALSIDAGRLTAELGALIR